VSFVAEYGAMIAEEAAKIFDMHASGIFIPPDPAAHGD
jgi:hypothetical protein